MKFKLSILLFVSSLFAPLTHAVPVTLGQGASCDYDVTMGQGLVHALNHSGVSEVRMEKDLVLDPVVIDVSVKLVGGYDNCSHAASNPEIDDTPERTTISGQNTQQAIRVFWNSALEIELHNLIIENGNAGTLATNNGGGIEVESNSQVALSIINSEIRNNLAFAGAGIYFAAGSGYNQLILRDVIVHDNMAENNQGNGYHGGGGIFVNGVDLTITGASQIRDNQIIAQGTGSSVGGGIFAANSNIIFVGDANSADSGIFNNTAELRGGGMYLGGGVNLMLSGSRELVNGSYVGSEQFPVVIKNNVATDDTGGGIYAITSEVSAESVVFEGNSALLIGGGMYLHNTELTIGGTSNHCWHNRHCNVFKQNAAARGGALYGLGPDTEVKITNTFFYDNSADLGTSLYTSNSAIAHVESVLIVGEGSTVTVFNPEDVIHNSHGANYINYVTIVENQVSNSIFTSLGNHIGNEVKNSIVYNPTANSIGFEDAGLSSNQYTCLLANTVENDSINIGAQNYANLFENPALIDFRLKPNAYAIDFCDGDAVPPTALDMQGKVRGVDDPRGNVFGIHDAGAYEYHPDDLIFIDTFNF